MSSLITVRPILGLLEVTVNFAHYDPNQDMEPIQLSSAPCLLRLIYQKGVAVSDDITLRVLDQLKFTRPPAKLEICNRNDNETRLVQQLLWRRW